MERSNLTYKVEASQKNLPRKKNISDDESKVITVGKEKMFNRGERGRNKLDERIISKDKKLHSTGITLFDTSINQKGGKEEILKTDGPFRHCMQRLNQSSEGFRKMHVLKHPEQISPGQRGEGRSNVEGKDARVGNIPDNVIDDLSFKGEN